MVKINKKIITILIVMLISFCLLSVVVADNGTLKNDTKDHTDIDHSDDKNHPKKTEVSKKDKSTDKSKGNYIVAKGHGKFSDGFTGIKLDKSKPSASTGDKFKKVSTSSLSNSNDLKLAVINKYKDDSSKDFENAVDDAINNKSSTKEKIGDHEVVKLDDNTEGVFDFEVLKSVSGNESDYFAYKVSFRAIEKTNTSVVNTTNTTVNTTNITNNSTNATVLMNNTTDSNATSLIEKLYDFLRPFIEALYKAWKPLLAFLTALSILPHLEDMLNELGNLYNTILGLLNDLEAFLKPLLDAINSLISAIVGLINQIIGLIGSIINMIIGLLNSILGLISQLLNAIMDLINAIISLLRDLLNALASFFGTTTNNAGQLPLIIIVIIVAIVAIVLVINHRKNN